MPLTITYGAGLARPQGKRVELPPGMTPTEAVASVLRTLPAGDEVWWAPTTWNKDYRVAKAWASSSGVSIDVDYETKDAAPPVELVAALSDAAATLRLPGTNFHLTPHGARIVFMYQTDCVDPELHLSAACGAAELVTHALSDLGLAQYEVDPRCHKDLGRLFFGPNAHAKGVQRSAEVVEMREQAYTPEELAEHEPQAAPPPKPEPPHRTTYREAVDRWNADHLPTWPRAAGDCPACGHRGCFGRLPDDDSRWHCFSSNHTKPGIPGANGYHGDALDLEAFARGVTPKEVLRADGYLSAPPMGQLYALPVTASSATPDDRTEKRYITNNSYLSVLTILRGNIKEVLSKDGRLRMNSMSGRPELHVGGVSRLLTDEDVSAIRGLMEQRLSGGEDKNGNPLGLKVKSGDVQAACSQVASENAYHPVQEYLRGLVWDGVERLDAVPEDLLGAERTALNQALIRRFFISAVARAMRPGCKVDTVLILIGAQGAMKSTFFRVLSSPWFLDSPIDIQSKDAYQTLRTAWIAEWAELESLARARDASAVKAFLTSPKDTYRPSFGRFAIDVERSSVIVGTTNDEEFLTDPTGNRRFWPMRVGQIDLARTSEQRDQLWAEARVRFERGEQWWLTGAETDDLSARHEQHQVQDAWKAPIETWSSPRLVEFTTADVLKEALGKPTGQWSRADEMRVARVVRQLGFVQFRVRSGVRVWRR